jgi:hypothetical protein
MYALNKVILVLYYVRGCHISALVRHFPRFRRVAYLGVWTMDESAKIGGWITAFGV